MIKTIKIKPMFILDQANTNVHMDRFTPEQWMVFKDVLPSILHSGMD